MVSEVYASRRLDSQFLPERWFFAALTWRQRDTIPK